MEGTCCEGGDLYLGDRNIPSESDPAGVSSGVAHRLRGNLLVSCCRVLTAILHTRYSVKISPPAQDLYSQVPAPTYRTNRCPQDETLLPAAIQHSLNLRSDARRYRPPATSHQILAVHPKHVAPNTPWRAAQRRTKLSADEDGFATSPSFSAAFSAAPPAFPRDGGPPAPSPRVSRGWTHESPPARRVSSTIERDLSYTSLVRQLNTGERRTRTLRRANEALGTRVNELESGAILRVTQARLAERDEVRHGMKATDSDMFYAR